MPKEEFTINKIIISDVDGTLFKSGNKVQPRKLELVHRFQEQGGIFTLATGRMKKAIEPFIDELAIRFPVIVYNGAQIVDPVTNQLLASKELTPSLAESALTLLEQYPLSPIMHVNQQPYVWKQTQEVLEHMKKDNIECLVHENLHDLTIHSPTKILVIGEPERLQEFEAAFQQTVENGFQLVYSDWNYLEILPWGASKGNALETLARIKGISMKHMIAVGDERNDISMLQAAGLGVAVANADETVQRQANRVTRGSWNQGLEEVIEAVLAHKKEYN
ncbi:MAG: Cof-type HAD-IIB family hydrolase [Bacillota bacterium]|nr:Cof-type HAD-IIB family hydrolase [Bacillota bacterium]MDW7678038.1 Cof-type HAD-IIB family hydrolase [Bacillota bacterium]